jgi:putative toxin-antitoxin system antitoxin component (TIGR02293 family)
MAIPKELLYKNLRLPRSTIDRKLRANEKLSPEHSERVIGLERLIGQVEAMVQESGDGTAFDAHVWLGDWLESPLPALGGARPGEYLDTMQGQDMVSSLLAQMQSGAYA